MSGLETSRLDSKMFRVNEGNITGTLRLQKESLQEIANQVREQAIERNGRETIDELTARKGGMSVLELRELKMKKQLPRRVGEELGAMIASQERAEIVEKANKVSREEKALSLLERRKDISSRNEREDKIWERNKEYKKTEKKDDREYNKEMYQLKRRDRRKDLQELRGYNEKVKRDNRRYSESEFNRRRELMPEKGYQVHGPRASEGINKLLAEAKDLQDGLSNVDESTKKAMKSRMTEISVEIATLGAKNRLPNKIIEDLTVRAGGVSLDRKGNRAKIDYDKKFKQLGLNPMEIPPEVRQLLKDNMSNIYLDRHNRITNGEGRLVRRNDEGKMVFMKPRGG